jgi:hypothetical protein
VDPRRGKPSLVLFRRYFMNALNAIKSLRKAVLDNPSESFVYKINGWDVRYKAYPADVYIAEKDGKRFIRKNEAILASIISK